MRCSPTRTVLAAVALTATGCGAGDEPERAGGAQTVRIVRVAFPASQHLAQPSTFAITVRNAGDTPIRELVGRLRGLSTRTSEGTRQRLWIADDSQDDDVATIDDARAAGPLAAGEEVTLRWRLTPAVAGTHRLTWAVTAGAKTRRQGGGRPRGTLTARVVATPPFARVDPRTGRVVREEAVAPR